MGHVDVGQRGRIRGVHLHTAAACVNSDSNDKRQQREHSESFGRETTPGRRPRPRHEAAHEAEATMDAPQSRFEHIPQYSAELNWRSSHLFDKLSILVAAVTVNDAEKHEPLRVSRFGSI